MRRNAAEVLLVLVLVAAWAATTAGIVYLTNSNVVWLFSGGLFGFSAAGWKLVGRLAWEGLYALTRGPRG
jgi:hypothetical protein